MAKEGVEGIVRDAKTINLLEGDSWGEFISGDKINFGKGRIEYVKEIGERSVTTLRYVNNLFETAYFIEASYSKKQKEDKITPFTFAEIYKSNEDGNSRYNTYLSKYLGLRNMHPLPEISKEEIKIVSGLGGRPNFLSIR